MDIMLDVPTHMFDIYSEQEFITQQIVDLQITNDLISVLIYGIGMVIALGIFAFVIWAFYIALKNFF